MDSFASKSNDKRELYVKTLPRELDEEVAALMVKGFGGTITKLTKKQSKYIDISLKGPFKKDAYRY